MKIRPRVRVQPNLSRVSRGSNNVPVRNPSKASDKESSLPDSNEAQLSGQSNFKGDPCELSNASISNATSSEKLDDIRQLGSDDENVHAVNDAEPIEAKQAELSIGTKLLALSSTNHQIEEHRLDSDNTNVHAAHDVLPIEAKVAVSSIVREGSELSSANHQTDEQRCSTDEQLLNPLKPAASKIEPSRVGRVNIKPKWRVRPSLSKISRESKEKGRDNVPNAESDAVQLPEVSSIEDKSSALSSAAVNGAAFDTNHENSEKLSPESGKCLTNNNSSIETKASDLPVTDFQANGAENSDKSQLHASSPVKPADEVKSQKELSLSKIKFRPRFRVQPNLNRVGKTNAGANERSCPKGPDAETPLSKSNAVQMAEVSSVDTSRIEGKFCELSSAPAVADEISSAETISSDEICEVTELQSPQLRPSDIHKSRTKFFTATESTGNSTQSSVDDVMDELTKKREEDDESMGIEGQTAGCNVKMEGKSHKTERTENGVEAANQKSSTLAVGEDESANQTFRTTSITGDKKCQEQCEDVDVLEAVEGKSPNDRDLTTETQPPDLFKKPLPFRPRVRKSLPNVSRFSAKLSGKSSNNADSDKAPEVHEENNLEKNVLHQEDPQMEADVDKNEIHVDNPPESVHIDMSKKMSLLKPRFFKPQPNLKKLDSRIARKTEPERTALSRQTDDPSDRFGSDTVDAIFINDALPVETIITESPASEFQTEEQGNNSEPLQLLPSSPLKSTKKKETHSRRLYTKTKEPPERSKMTMMDLIYWNPRENPMKSSSSKSLPQIDVAASTQSQDKENSARNSAEEDSSDSFAPAPQLKIDENGMIILDEESLVIQHTTPENYLTIAEDSATNYSSFRNRQLPRRWSCKETAIFYKALTVVGTDFALMANLITDRSRYELKAKFKREEKKNGILIDKILRCPTAFDLERFEQDVEELQNSPFLQEPVKRKKCSSGKSFTVDRPRSQMDSEAFEIIEASKRQKQGTSAMAEESKKCRGRKPKNCTESTSAETVAEPQSQGVPKKRGRKRKAVETMQASVGPYTEVQPGSTEQKKRRGRKPKMKSCCNVKDSLNFSDVDDALAEYGISDSVNDTESDAIASDGINEVVFSLEQGSEDVQNVVLLSEDGEILPVELIYEADDNVTDEVCASAFLSAVAVESAAMESVVTLHKNESAEFIDTTTLNASYLDASSKEGGKTYPPLSGAVYACDAIVSCVQSVITAVETAMKQTAANTLDSGHKACQNSRTPLGRTKQSSNIEKNRNVARGRNRRVHPNLKKAKANELIQTKATTSGLVTSTESASMECEEVGSFVTVETHKRNNKRKRNNPLFTVAEETGGPHKDGESGYACPTDVYKSAVMYPAENQCKNEQIADASSELTNGLDREIISIPSSKIREEIKKQKLNNDSFVEKINEVPREPISLLSSFQMLTQAPEHCVLPEGNTLTATSTSTEQSFRIPMTLTSSNSGEECYVSSDHLKFPAHPVDGGTFDVEAVSESIGHVSVLDRSALTQASLVQSVSSKQFPKLFQNLNYSRKLGNVFHSLNSAEKSTGDAELDY